MRIKTGTLSLVGLLALSIGLGACKPRTKVEKVENKFEDAKHEVKQGAERAGERVKDATK